MITNRGDFMADETIERLTGWKQPLYAEVFAEFIDRYGRQVDDHWRFSQEVGRLIGIAQSAAVEPLQKVLVESMNRVPMPMTFRETELRLPPDAHAIAERIAQITAHRACGGEEHDPINGKIHGCCIVCVVPWPCEYAGAPPEKVATT